VLHPKAIHPAAQKDIPVHIYNSKQPAATGTSISRSVPQCANLIKSIAYKRPVALIYAKGESFAGGTRDLLPDDFLKTLIAALSKHKTQPLITAVSASSAVLAVDARELGDGRERDLMEEISKFATASLESNKAIISLVGEQLGSDPKVVGRVFKALDEIQLGVIMHGSSPITTSFIVDERDVENIIARLHEVFFKHLDPQVFE
jgi:aspartate kinase